MKVVIVEVEMDEYKTVSTCTLKSNFNTTWVDGCKEYGLTEEIIDSINKQGTLGWCNGVNRFGNPVKRTYMLIPN